MGNFDPTWIQAAIAIGAMLGSAGVFVYQLKQAVKRLEILSGRTHDSRNREQWLILIITLLWRKTMDGEMPEPPEQRETR